MFLAEHTQENVLYLKFSGISRLHYSITEAMKKEMPKALKNLLLFQ
jgi:uncharacterized protein YxeA